MPEARSSTPAAGSRPCRPAPSNDRRRRERSCPRGSCLSSFRHDDAAGLVAQEILDRAGLDDIDAQRIGPARIAPGDRVMARRSRPLLHEAAPHRKARLRRGIEQRDSLPDSGHVEHAGVHAVERHRLYPALGGFEVVAAVRGGDDAARTEHDVVIQLAGKLLIKPEREIIKRRALRIVVVRAG